MAGKCVVGVAAHLMMARKQREREEVRRESNRDSKDRRTGLGTRYAPEMHTTSNPFLPPKPQCPSFYDLPIRL